VLVVERQGPEMVKARTLPYSFQGGILKSKRLQEEAPRSVKHWMSRYTLDILQNHQRRETLEE